MTSTGTRNNNHTTPLPLCPTHGVEIIPAQGRPQKTLGVAGLFVYRCPVGGQEFVVYRPAEADQ